VARVVIHHYRAQAESADEAVKFLRKVLHEIRFNARLHLFHGPYTTGHLASTLVVDGPTRSPGRVSGAVRATAPYARFPESGAKPHIIRPRPPKKRLRFYWRRVGRVVRPPLVHHPGQRGKHYLLEAARTAARRHNMILVVYEQ
jgi:hypothetical protein